ncbi:hypothetical protein BCR42DRAFT_495239 [Absidia repens]|uniref:Uncharacterized protein n=1 Tax=Absidia repens TaxID=90262 RepID=A0A1X2I453_9FUNG|nr:hypothetical protein BCR42DRAFT_495239 [Absidia repens]
MTNSAYTLPTTTRKHSEDTMSDYMEINNDDAEAGSILMSLSQQPKQNTKPSPPPSANSTNTMSIRNLLGDSDEGTKHCVPYQTKPMETATAIATTAQQEAKEIPPTYTERRQFTHGMHAQTTSPTLPAASSRMRSTSSPVKNPTESYNWQQQQLDSPPHTYHPQTTQHQYQQLQQQHQRQQHNQYQQHQQHQHQQHQQHQQQQPIKKPYHRQEYQSSYSQQSYQSMKNNPKVRRNALHAYISYMTYSDLTRMKSSRPHPSYSYNVTPPMGKQQYHHPERPPPPPASTAIYERPPPAKQQQQQSQYQQQPPLTAFLKHPHVDPPATVTTPTTPRPNPSLPSIDNHHPPQHHQHHHHLHRPHSMDYVHAHDQQHHPHPYHSPPLPQPQYRQAYPVLPYPPKHP